jgi:hypothetical protein
MVAEHPVHLADHGQEFMEVELQTSELAAQLYRTVSLLPVVAVVVDLLVPAGRPTQAAQAEVPRAMPEQAAAVHQWQAAVHRVPVVQKDMTVVVADMAEQQED